MTPDRDNSSVVGIPSGDAGGGFAASVDRERFVAVVEELGLGKREAIDVMEPLAGGVASDIVRVEIGGRTYCLKCALEKLRVKQDWHAPVHRNRSEYAWLQVASSVIPDGAVQLFGRSARAPCFAMEFLDGDDVYLWKSRLLAGQVSLAEARSVGHSLALIQSVSTDPEFSSAGFENRADFHQLRLDPYLNAAAAVHPSVSASLHALVDDLGRADAVLVHGDISPKNIMFRSGRPVFLDAECATMGDASFDIAFCLNHLVLKSIHIPDRRTEFMEAAMALWSSYIAGVSWEAHDALEARVCALLPALMLARIDGKSPVEYLHSRNRQRVRRVALTHIRCGLTDMASLVSSLNRQLDNNTS